MLTIRKGKISDCEKCHEISNTRELLNADGKMVSSEWFRACVKQKGILLIAEDGNKIVGYVAGETLIEHGAILHLIAVINDYRKCGIGHKLILAFEKECRRRHVKWILVYAYDTKIALKFFEKSKYIKGSKTVEFIKILE